MFSLLCSDAIVIYVYFVCYICPVLFASCMHFFLFDLFTSLFLYCLLSSSFFSNHGILSFPLFYFCLPPLRLTPLLIFILLVTCCGPTNPKLPEFLVT